MNSKKAKQQLQARRKRQRRRQRSDPLIGYYAVAGGDAVCDGDGLIIAASEAEMGHIIERLKSGMRYDIRGTTANEILSGLRLGAAYCFDEQSYDRFLEPARQAGIPLTDEDFSDPGPLGMHFVRVQHFSG